jgi:hypothetical protein
LHCRQKVPSLAQKNKLTGIHPENASVWLGLQHPRNAAQPQRVVPPKDQGQAPPRQAALHRLRNGLRGLGHKGAVANSTKAGGGGPGACCAADITHVIHRVAQLRKGLAQAKLAQGAGALRHARVGLPRAQGRTYNVNALGSALA